ncbi:MAG: leucine-rich repeat domain-containing protein [Candidatus Poribacteria bacterium]|nr:leucine-rich repeat domain-containing protein [Candidatus Poribacteria bacterium]
MQIANKQHILLSIIALSTTLFLAPLSTSAQVVTIPDANLRAVINEALDKPENARITREGMQTLTILHADNRGITDLTGLETATNLRDLTLRDNLISDLTPLASRTRLQQLTLSNNVIVDLSPLASLINLRKIEIGGNFISDLSPLASLINLREIGIGGNPISDLSPLAGLIRLEEIWMSEIPLADLTPLSGLINLRAFSGWDTPIVNLEAIAELPKLYDINVCNAGISDISPLAKAKGLTGLYLAESQITDLSPIAGLTNLKFISFRGNQISDISPLKNLTNLTWVDLSENEISDVSPLAENQGLTWIDLSNNLITDPTPLTNLDNLNWIGLTRNTISDETVFDKFTDRTAITHSNFVNTRFPEAGPKIEGPWLWVIVPGTLLHKNTDLIAKATGGAATEIKIATFGATEGKTVGDSEWEAHTLAPTGGDNLNEMTDALGWGFGSEIYGHVVYGSVTLNSPQKQETTMLVGSDDAVKVWLNGERVHYNPVTRGAGDFQDAFPVTLKAGVNVLLVAVDNHGHGTFSGFFGFANDANYTVNPINKKFVITVPKWDVNRDGEVNILDLILVAQDIGKTSGTNLRTDVNDDGTRNIQDLILVASHLGELSGAAAAPLLNQILTQNRISPTVLQAWIAQAQVENDGSYAFQKGIANLQKLLTALAPEETALLPNYPNPFNPETWIPYQLAEPAEVTLRIYAINGELVRTLALGHQPAGLYQTRTRAAYWDGKNALGEPVASGVYFYTLSTESTRDSVTAGDFNATRKMLIMK